MPHQSFYVSCKAVLLSPDHTKVLLTETRPGAFGLPGGHLEANESVNECINRELNEETGLDYKSIPHLERCDFFVYNVPDSQRVVLIYHGVLSPDVHLTHQPEEMINLHWISIDSDIVTTLNTDYVRVIKMVAKKDLQKLAG